jgi:hypothetical protein
LSSFLDPNILLRIKNVKLGRQERRRREVMGIELTEK